MAQEILFEMLTRGQGYRVGVFVVSGPGFTGPDTTLEVRRFDNGKGSAPMGMTLEGLRQAFKRWYQWADHNPEAKA